MFGYIGKMIATAGKRDELIAIIGESSREMPGCFNYIIAKDRNDANAIWITEIWDSAESHQASLSLPAVQQAIEKAKPLIAGFEMNAETEPVMPHRPAQNN